ncbi:hypothetical protein BH20ACI2_BH20ACI2_02760 [soil metagenome]
MKNIRNWITLGVFSLLVLGIPAIANAQWRDNRDRGRYDDRGYNNGAYGTYGNYGNRNGVVRSLKDRTKEFVRQLDRDLDRSRINGTRQEDRINAQAKQFRDAVNRINNNNNNNNWGRRDNNVERALQIGSQLDRSISRVRLSYQSQDLWQSISRDLQMLGNGYGYDTRNNRGNRSGGGWNNGRMPSWWPF